MKKIFVSTVFWVLCFSTLLSAAEQEDVSDRYRTSLDAWMNNEISSNRMLGILSELEEALAEQNLTWETCYWKSRVSLLRGQIYYEQKENSLSIRELEDCLGFAEQANEIRERSETLSTMALAGSLLMNQKGFLFIIANYSIPQKQAERALELDPQNPHALLVRAQFLCNAPPIAGGNLEEGIAMFRELSERNNLGSADRFIILQSLAEIYLNNGNPDQAAAACRQALTIFPGNRECLTILSELER